MDREPLLIVDGYNLLHRLVPKRLLAAPRGLERARAMVVQRVGGLLSAEELPRTVVVFDAAGTSGADETLAAGSPAEGVRVLFATGYPDADTLVEELIRRHSAPARLTVVSSDRRLIRAAQKRGAAGTDCDQWLDQREQNAGRRRESSSEAEDSPRVRGLTKEDESRYWLREFGFGGAGPEE